MCPMTNLTKKPMFRGSIRIPRQDKQLWSAAAAQEQVSQSEFLRVALRERAVRVLTSRNEQDELNHARRGES